jgi:hypothetical protein
MALWRAPASISLRPQMKLPQWSGTNAHLPDFQRSGQLNTPGSERRQCSSRSTDALPYQPHLVRVSFIERSIVMTVLVKTLGLVGGLIIGFALAVGFDQGFSLAISLTALCGAVIFGTGAILLIRIKR